MLFVLKPKKRIVNKNKREIALTIVPWGRVSLAMS